MSFLLNQKLYTHVQSLKCAIGFLKKKLYYFQLQSNNWYFPVCRCTLEQPLPLSSTLATWGSTSQHERSWWPTTFNKTNLPNTLVSSRSNVKNIQVFIALMHMFSVPKDYHFFSKLKISNRNTYIGTIWLFCFFQGGGVCKEKCFISFISSAKFALYIGMHS